MATTRSNGELDFVRTLWLLVLTVALLAVLAGLLTAVGHDRGRIARLERVHRDDRAHRVVAQHARPSVRLTSTTSAVPPVVRHEGFRGPDGHCVRTSAELAARAHLRPDARCGR